MIVLDASVVVELLLNRQAAQGIVAKLAASSRPMAAPQILDIEVLSALRRLTFAGHILTARWDDLLLQLSLLPVERYSHLPLLARIWQLRNNFTPYDATYIALAEELKGELFTMDGRLARGHRAEVTVFGRRE